MIRVTEKDIAQKTKAKTIVLFRADWCPYCRRFKPIFDSYEGKTGAALAEAVVNEDEDPLWDRYNITVVPTIVAFQNGKEVARKSGKPAMGLSKDDMEALLKQFA